MEDCKGLPEKVAKLEVKVEKHEDLLKSQVEKNEALIKLSALMEMQMKQNEEREKRQEERDQQQNKQMEKITNTLDKVSDSLDELSIGQKNLNNNYDNLNGRLGVLEADISEVKNDNKIDLPKLKKDIITKVIPSVIGGLLLAWIISLLSAWVKTL